MTKTRRQIEADLKNEIKTSDADCGEVCVIKTQTTEVYYESGKVSMIRTNENISANVKVIKDNKKGIVSTNDISTEEAKKKIVSDALESAASAPEDDANGRATGRSSTALPKKIPKNFMTDLPSS